MSSIEVEGLQYLQSFLSSQKERYKAPGNAINYIATVAEGCVDPAGFSRGQLFLDHESDRAALFLEEAFSNLVSVVAEYPIAESIREDHREYAWTRESGEFDLLLHATPFRQILVNAIETTQKADFELPRYTANLAYHDTFVAGRKAGDARPFVEFSPSPEHLMQAAYDRGYRGNSYIGVFEMTGGVERFTQFWFRAPWEEIANLVRSLGNPLPEKASDTDIMRASNFMSEKDVQFIHSFIEKKRGVIAQNSEKIREYIRDELRPTLERQLGELLKNAAEKLLRGESVELEERLIIDTLRFAQNKLNQRIATIGQAPIRFVRVSREQEEFYDANPFLRSQFVEKENLPLVGCGSSVSNTKETSDPFGINDSRESDEFGPLSFECPKCQKTVVRQRGKLLEKCPHCGASVRC